MKGTSRRRDRTVPYTVMVSAALTSAAAAWFATSFGSSLGSDYLIGPYSIPVELEVAAAVVAALALVGSLTAWLRSAAPGQRGLGLDSTALILFLAAGTMLMWRVVTRPGGGANIGGGMALIFWPMVVLGVAGFVCASEARARGNERWSGPISVITGCVCVGWVVGLVLLRA